MRISVVESLEEIAAQDWNHLAGDRHPFLRHEFLIALERHEGVGPRFGWYPRYLTATDGARLVGAVPMYLKNNSYGEFVFDWAWADAYQRAGLSYYPKLVVAAPYTPATGPRLLLDPARSAEPIAQALMQGAQDYAQELGVSSLHWLFPDPTDMARLQQQGLLLRSGCQFHWENRGYRDFDDFLSTFAAEKRKKIKRERRRVQEQGVTIEVLHGDELSAEQWAVYHAFYTDTFDRKGGMPTLSRGFFEELGRTMPRNVVLVLASHGGRYVAAAFNLRGADTLYGRHWGASEEFHSLHFEACYYQGLDYCIREGLRRFEPGAQGEHKISRGFLPTPTWSAHWIAHPQFRRAIADFLERERHGMDYYMKGLHEHSPYKAPAAT